MRAVVFVCASESVSQQHSTMVVVRSGSTPPKQQSAREAARDASEAAEEAAAAAERAAERAAVAAALAASLP